MGKDKARTIAPVVRRTLSSCAMNRPIMSVVRWAAIVRFKHLSVIQTRDTCFLCARVGVAQISCSGSSTIVSSSC